MPLSVFPFNSLCDIQPAACQRGIKIVIGHFMQGEDDHGMMQPPHSEKTPKRIAATSAGPMVELQVVQDFLEEEQRPADAREWPGDVDRKHVDARHLRFLLETEQREAPAKGDEDERDQEHRDIGDAQRANAKDAEPD